jgi:ABC-type branched-subunit amino acid transport system substrate-binding protein
MFRHGVALYDEGRFAEADTVFGKFLSQYPLGVQSSAATIMRAKALYVSGRNLESATVARAFLSTFPSSAYVADAHYLLGVIYRRIRRGEDAMRELLLAWETLPRPQPPPRLHEALQSVADSVADQDVSAAFLRSLLGTTPGRGPQAFLWLKMAEKGAAAEDIKAARLALDTLLSSYPEMAGHPRVSTLLGRIAERSDVKIAALLPLMRESEMSGAKEIAADIADGIQYAVERFSLDTEQRVRVTLVQHDTQRETQRAASGVRTLAADQKLVAILGPVFSNTTLAAARAAQEIGIPLISPTANANGIAAAGRCVFQANPDYEFRGKAMARYAVLTRGFQRLAVLAPSDSYGKFLAQGFLDEAKRLGARVIAAEWYERGSSDFKSQLGAIRLAGLRAASDPYIAFGGRKKLGELMKLVGLGVSVRVLDSLMACGALVQASKLVGPDAAPRLDSLGIRVVYNEIFLDSLDVPVQAIDGIYLPINSPEEIGSISSQVVYFNIQAQLLGSGEWNNLSELDASRRYCAGMVFESDTYVDITTPSYAAWAAGFTTRYKRSPSKHVLFGYDTADMLLGVLREGATTREAITRALARVKEYQGLHAKVGFSSGRVNVWVSILQFDGRGVIHVGDIQAE